MDTKILKEIGLTDNEIKVYLTMLEEDENLASTIANKTRINRSLVYTILTNLINKGMISYVIKENRKYFKATAPEKILNVLKEKEQEIRKQEEKIKEIIPKLKSLKLPKKEEPSIEVYKGKEGLKTVLDDVLKEGKDYQMIGYTAIGTKIAEYWFAHWHRRRIKMGIKRKILAPYTLKGKSVMKYPLTKAKYFPSHYSMQTSTLIYGDKATIYLPLKNDFLGIMIKSKEIIETYRSQFNLLWKIAKK